MKYLPLLLIPLFTGCTANMAKYAQALANDPAFVSVRVTGIWGTGLMVRDGRPESANTVSPDGVITSTPSVRTNAVVR